MLLLDLRPSCGHPAGHLSPPRCSIPGHVHLRVPGWGAPPPPRVHVLSPLLLSTSRTAVTCFTPQREGCAGAGSLSNSPSNQDTAGHIGVWSLTVSVIKYTCQAGLELGTPRRQGHSPTGRHCQTVSPAGGHLFVTV